MQHTERFWIAFGDIHEQTRAVPRIPDLEQADAVLVSGDLTNVGGRDKAARVLEPIERRNPRILAQIGNMDTAEADALLTERGLNVHGRVTDLGRGVGLAAVGYSTPTPFGTPSEVGEERISRWVRQVLEQAASFEHVVLMVHTPPHGTALDRLTSGMNVGSPGVRALIEEFQPAIVITGHIHEAVGQDSLGHTALFNPGALAQGGYVRIIHGESGLRGCLERVR